MIFIIYTYGRSVSVTTCSTRIMYLENKTVIFQLACDLNQSEIIYEAFA
jgi:hypothetical protein